MIASGEGTPLPQKLAENKFVRTGLTSLITIGGLGLITAPVIDSPNQNQESGHHSQIQGFADRFSSIIDPRTAHAQEVRPYSVTLDAMPSQTFAETGKTVQGQFLNYWIQHGGLAQQGLPISDADTETSPTDGQDYVTQYFERAEFELHPENQAPYDVLLSLLGTFRYDQKYPDGAPGQTPNESPGAIFFKETGHHLGGKFLDYWKSHGGLTQQGYPISDEFKEISELNGKTYKVQYFQRAEFEEHPEYAGTQNEVLLSQLGTFQYKDKVTGEKPVVNEGLNWKFQSDAKAPFIVRPVSDRTGDLNNQGGTFPNPLNLYIGSGFEGGKTLVKSLGLDSNPSESGFEGFPIYDQNSIVIGSGYIWNPPVNADQWKPHPTVVYFSPGISGNVNTQNIEDTIIASAVGNMANSYKERQSTAIKYLNKIKADVEVVSAAGNK